jgi:hypothetical protein
MNCAKNPMGKERGESEEEEETREGIGDWGAARHAHT